MAFGGKTKFLLELVLALSGDALLSAVSARRCLMQSGGYDHVSSLLRQLRRAEQAGLLEGAATSGSEWVPRITAKGMEELASCFNPEPKWGRVWDGRWRTLTFDLPASERKERRRLDAWLAGMRFGHLQGSLRVTAESYELWGKDFESLELDPRSVIFIEGRPLGGLSDALLVERAWDFSEMRERYQQYIRFLNEGSLGEEAADSLEGFVAWFRKESSLWRWASEADPFLPESLLPAGYLGREAWQSRQAAIGRWKQNVADA